ncbi:hypothetical protein HPP92_004219 [Vanilla planifolia]|uniref:Uncharacterized protein n=1 Tax=Vanilla planifolia TaxID=51239 RepID=A0A835RZ28_VANPL|nr:hypothetical protein HPP92_004219 [Vanilla planifolia]
MAKAMPLQRSQARSNSTAQISTISSLTSISFILAFVSLFFSSDSLSSEGLNPDSYASNVGLAYASKRAAPR